MSRQSQSHSQVSTWGLGSPLTSGRWKTKGLDHTRTSNFVFVMVSFLQMIPHAEVQDDKQIKAQLLGVRQEPQN